jgi:hypothetical protein
MLTLARIGSVFVSAEGLCLDPRLRSDNRHSILGSIRGALCCYNLNRGRPDEKQNRSRDRQGEL